jgi:hypothetical protein
MRFDAVAVIRQVCEAVREMHTIDRENIGQCAM